MRMTDERGATHIVPTRHESESVMRPIIAVVAVPIVIVLGIMSAPAGTETSPDVPFSEYANELNLFAH